MLPACLLVLLVTRQQDPAPEPTLTERVAALIAKSNAYEGFVAHYRVRSGDGEHTLRIAYSAPQTLVLDFEAHGARGFTRLQADSWDDLRFERGSETRRASVKNWNLEPGYTRHMRAVFDEEFPGALRADDVPGSDSPVITLRPDRESMSFSFGFGPVQGARLDWLAYMRRAPERLSLVGDGNKEFAFSFPGDLTMFVSCENGFVTRLQRRTKSGELQGVELMSVQTDPRPSDAEFALPDPGPQVRDFSDELEEFTAGMGFSNSRKNLFSALAKVIDDGRLKWTEESPAKLERIVRAMRAVDFEPVCARRLANSHAVTAKASTTFAELVRDLDRSDEAKVEWLSGSVDLSRRTLEELLEKALVEAQSQEGPSPNCKLRPSLYDELVAMEKPILSEMFLERVTKPALAEFDEKVAKQLEPK